MNSIEKIKKIKGFAPFEEQKKNIENLFEEELIKEEDGKKISLALAEHGYYRLKGYVKPFLQRRSGRYVCKESFDTIRKTIDIDLSLREFLLINILKIENHITLLISEKLSKENNPYWHMNCDLFIRTTLSRNDSINNHRNILKKIKESTELDEDGKHSHPGLVRYAEKHDPDHIPSWIVRECISFGTWVQIFDALGNEQKSEICKLFRFKKQNSSKRFELSGNELISWIRSLNVLRNNCAHNGLISNKIFSFSPAQHQSAGLIENRSGPNILPRIKVMQFLLSAMPSDPSGEFIKNVNSIIYMHESNGISDSIIHKIFGFDKENLNK
jgi:abortive infection bacteriophage resistance protein